ncbi:MAG: hypothetical protein RIB98_05830 [Acidimicrobiales bacterium]
MPSDSMPSDDELRSRMQRLAATREVADLSVEEVMGRRSSTARRQRLLAVAAVLLLVAGVAGVVRLFTDDGGSNADVASGADEDAEEAEQPADEPDETADAEGDATTTTLATGGDVPAMTSSYYGGGSWVVPWGDGFLSFGQVLEPSDATMADLVPDIADRMPPEVMEALGDVTDVDEATALLDSVGLLDEATTAVMDDPVLYDAYNQVMAGGTYRAEASVSNDGENWTVLADFAPPGGGEYINYVRSDGEHLVVVEQRWDETTEDAEIIVHSTADLVSWTSTPIPQVAADVPDFVESDQYANDIALFDGGWYLTVGTSSWVDIWSLMPADVLAEFGDSYGWTVEVDGVRVSSGGEMIYEEGDVGISGAGESGGAMSDDSAEATTTTVVPQPATTDEGTTRLVPWSDLGITFADYERYAFSETGALVAHIGSWDGALAPANPPGGLSCCTVVGTDAGLLAQTWATWDEQTGEQPARLYFSADGQTWSDVAYPAGVSFNSLTAVVGGVVAVDQSGTVWRAAADGTGWASVEIDGLPAMTGLWFEQQNGGVATVVDVAVYDYEYEQVPYTVTFEQDGFEIRSVNASDGGVAVTVTDVATGDVVLERSFNQYEAAFPEFVRYDDTGNVELLDDAGEVVVSVPMETYDRETSAAIQAAQEAAGWEEPVYDYQPDFWLVATSDGITWFVEDLVDTEDAGFGQAAINGNLVVVRDWAGGWETIAIG